MEKALSIQGVGGARGGKPVKDKNALAESLEEVLYGFYTFYQELGMDLDAIRSAEGFDCIRSTEDAMDAMVKSQEIKRRYLDPANAVYRQYQAIKPNKTALEFSMKIAPIRTTSPNRHIKYIIVYSKLREILSAAGVHFTSYPYTPDPLLDWANYQGGCLSSFPSRRFSEANNHAVITARRITAAIPSWAAQLAEMSTNAFGGGFTMRTAST